MWMEDGLFKVIKEYQFDLKRNDVPITEFLKKHYKKYISDLKDAVSKTDNRFLPDEIYTEIEVEVHIIEKICAEIIDTLELYDSAKIEKATSRFNQAMDKFSPYLMKSYISEGEHGEYYRIRVCKNDTIFSQKEMFHIPFDKRAMVKPYRYSIAGYPCLYLASTKILSWFECGMPKLFQTSNVSFVSGDEDRLKLIDFSYFPIELIGNLHWLVLNNRNNGEIVKINNCIKKCLFSYPLRAACSLRVKDRTDPFIQEYTIPQLLLLWVKENDDFHGIKYRTSSYIDKAGDIISHNVVLPTKDIRADGISALWAKHFKISAPRICNVASFFDGYKSQIGQLKVYLTNLEESKGNDYYYFEYKSTIIEFCKTIIMIYNCLCEENYNNSEILFQTITSLYYAKETILLAKEVWKDKVITTSKGQCWTITELEIRNKIEEDFEEFEKSVSELVSKNIDYYLSCSIKIDTSTLIHI